jgi:hypothetical protein
MKKFLLPAAILVGIAIAFIDSRPSWDDTGITAGLLFLGAAFFAFLASNRPWLWALAVGIWIPLYSAFVTHNYGGILAVVFAVIGAYAGWFAKNQIEKG